MASCVVATESLRHLNVLFVVNSASTAFYALNLGNLTLTFHALGVNVMVLVTLTA